MRGIIGKRYEEVSPGSYELLSDHDQLECQACGRVETMTLGNFGSVEYYRCRACGMDSYIHPPIEKEEIE